MMIPGVVTMIPVFDLLVRLGLYESYLGLVLPAAFSTFGTFLFRQFMLGIPISLDQAAEIARGEQVTLAIFTFMGNFNAFQWPLIVIKSEHLKTLPVGLLFFQGLYDKQSNLMMAATVKNLQPMVVIFVSFQKFLVKDH